eukprot:1936793-Prymnesium_polylepis.1
MEGATETKGRTPESPHRVVYPSLRTNYRDRGDETGDVPTRRTRIHVASRVESAHPNRSNDMCATARDYTGLARPQCRWPLDVLHPDHAPPPGKTDTHFT